MIPEGLVLLTSLNFALAAIRLARKNTLVQELESVETLARVDCLNLDKTGTVIDGGIMLNEIRMLDGIGANTVDEHASETGVVRPVERRTAERHRIGDSQRTGRAGILRRSRRGARSVLVGTQMELDCR